MPSLVGGQWQFSVRQFWKWGLAWPKNLTQHIWSGVDNILCSQWGRFGNYISSGSTISPHHLWSGVDYILSSYWGTSGNYISLDPVISMWHLWLERTTSWDISEAILEMMSCMTQRSYPVIFGLVMPISWVLSGAILETMSCGTQWSHPAIFSWVTTSWVLEAIWKLYLAWPSDLTSSPTPCLFGSWCQVLSKANFGKNFSPRLC